MFSSFQNLAQLLAKNEQMKMLSSLIRNMRLTQGSLALNGIMKPIINELTKYTIDTVIQGLHAKDVDLIKEQLGSLAASYYTLESMIYMTAGLNDIYHKQDVEVEAAMVQAYAIQAMTDFIIRPTQSIGSPSVCKGSKFDRLIRDAIQFSANGEHLDATQQYLCLSSLSYAGHELCSEVTKTRNPLHHPSFIFSRMLVEKSIETPKRKQKLFHYLHPSLEPAGNMLEDSIIRLSAAAEILLGRHGQLVSDHSVEVAKLAKAATLCYAMFCVTSRASRSYCIGLRNADQEMNMANVICFLNSKKVKDIAMEIDSGEHGTTEATWKTIGEKLLERKEYQFEHPTARNF
jgi:acyl-CoA dehydrogenase family member 9